MSLLYIRVLIDTDLMCMSNRLMLYVLQTRSVYKSKLCCLLDYMQCRMSSYEVRWFV